MHNGEDEVVEDEVVEVVTTATPVARLRRVVPTVVQGVAVVVEVVFAEVGVLADVLEVGLCRYQTQRRISVAYEYVPAKERNQQPQCR